jgi:hypothetical protein
MKGSLERPRLIVVLALVVALSGCASSLRMSIDHDAEVDFSQLTSFDWHSEATNWPNSFFDSTLRAAVNEELAAGGFVQNSDNPDLFVIAHTSLNEVVSGQTIVHMNHGWGWYRGWGSMGTTSVQVHTVTEGTLILDFVDASTNQLVWRGIVEKAIQDPRATRDVLRPIIQSLLSDFPPAQSE